MLFHKTELVGAYRLEVELIEDERGFFARSWSRDEFVANGLEANLAQCSISYNRVKGTLRGMHFQTAPYEETKLVRCTRGAIHDVIVDLRRDSPTFRRWQGFELNEYNRAMLYVPKGFAHGYLTLTEDAEVFYQISESYHPEAAAGVRWDDPAFGIDWPGEVRMISSRDASYPPCRD